MNPAGQRDTLMHLAVVACRERLGEAVNMLKTAAMLSSRAVRFHIFAEDQLHANIKATVSIIFVTSTCEVKRKERFSKSIFFYSWIPGQLSFR